VVGPGRDHEWVAGEAADVQQDLAVVDDDADHLPGSVFDLLLHR